MDKFTLWAKISEIVGGFATGFTFLLMLCDSRNKSKQLDSVTKIESLQMEALYKPDVRISSWTGAVNVETQSKKIIVENNGENLTISSIDDLGASVISRDGMMNWFPLYFDAGTQIRIPLVRAVDAIPDGDGLMIHMENKLGQKYNAVIKVNSRKPSIQIIKS